ncbi:hypothetical protein DFH06DRAFT_1471509 [Mycena polygramma]|nr:hypothetical protein DFH06DRAFT_1471509 [Mycena polygramma]
MAHLEPVFPVELEREIFETTALMYPKEIPSLLRVARRVLVWVEPLLYRIIHIAGNPGMASALLSAMSTKPPQFFRAVRHLDLDSGDLGPGASLRLFWLCNKIVDLIIRPNSTNPILLPILAQMRVQRLSMYLGLMFRGSINLQHKLFHSGTHLDIFDRQGVLEALSDVPKLPALTHLCLHSSIPRDDILKVLSECPRLSILLVQYSIMREDEYYGEAQFPHVYDARFVISLDDKYWEDWVAGAKGFPGVWSAAEAFVARKRKGEIEATRYWLD